MLARKVADRFAEAEKVSEKMLRFAYAVGKENRPGRQTAAQFARYYLMRLGIGHDLRRIALDPKHPRRISSEAELLTLRPELHRIE